MKKKIVAGFLKLWVCFLTTLLLVAVTVVPVLADTSVTITVTAQGAFVGISCNQSTYNFGTIATSTTTNTSGNWALISNTSSVSTNGSVRMMANAWTSAGTGWTHSDSAAGANTAAMKISSDNSTVFGASVFVKFTAPYNEFYTSVAAGSSVQFGLSLLAPTSFTDGNSNNNTLQINAYSSS